MMINVPTQNQALVKGDAIDPNWYFALKQTMKWINENSQHGTTAQRPVTNLYIGRQFYDTTVGDWIAVHSTNPTVWHKGGGAVV